MRAAGAIASEGHKYVMRNVEPGMTEYNLAHLFKVSRDISQTFVTLNGADPVLPYKPIVGGGTNGAILHYYPTNRPLQANELVLCDMGCSVSQYASDITSTFPVNGSFTTQQSVLGA